MTTPYLDEAERCSRVVLLHEGRVLAIDAPGALRQTIPEGLIEILADPSPGALDAIRSTPFVESAESFGERVHVRLTADAMAQGVERLTGELIRRGVTVRGIRRIPASLEDVFIELLRKAA
jgi:ABC-2 type transport system ATP-binding protein